MAGNGFAPSRDSSNRNKKAKFATLRSDNKLRGKPLKKGFLGIDKDGVEIEWHPATVELYEAFRRSPQAVLAATDLDWIYMRDTCLMHHQMWTTRRFELAGEVRQRLAKFGFTPEDRAKMRFEVEIVEVHPVGNGGFADDDDDDLDEFTSRREQMMQREQERLAQGG